jgi:hypothetical protein
MTVWQSGAPQRLRDRLAHGARHNRQLLAGGTQCFCGSELEALEAHIRGQLDSASKLVVTKTRTGLEFNTVERA